MRRYAWAALLASSAAAQTFSGSPLLDAAVEQAVRENQAPGAVLLVAHQGQVRHHRPYGRRALAPQPEPMTLDTVFDCASLTKVVATAASVMKLFEQGRIRLADPVIRYLPEFQGGGDITVRHLLTHFSGLRGDLDLEPPWAGYQAGVALALQERPLAPPGARFIYSDINYILLGEIVRRLSGQPLDEFARVHIFLPLGMRETRFRPPASLAARIAPTERVEGEVLRGVVHDPTARRMGGVAGHAGLFSTARDLARFADMMLARGAAPQTPHSPVLSPATVAAFTAPQSPPNQPLLRALGWDIDTQFSAPRGELFPLGSYGHTGFTGTSIWIDPLSRAYVILLANSVHPERRPAITSLRSRVATITAASLGIEFPGVLIAGYNQTLEGPGARRRTTRNAETLTGLDVLAAGGFAPLKGKRVGLLTNHTGIDRRGRPNLELLLEAGVQVAALFSPEHGFDGRQDHENIPHSSDPATGIRIFSLYQGNSRRPTPAMLRGLDVLVFDVQDIGVRFYTYISSLGYALEECARAGVAVYVLDRPNPLTGVRVEGPMLDPDNLSFTGYFPLPLRHGMTVGELALLFNSEKKLGANLTVIPMKNWQRGDWFDSSSLAWVNPSPNIRGLEAALLYPALALLEYSKNYSVGRGTDFPFEQIGASFIRGPELASYLNSRKIPGVRLYPVRFPHAGETVEGVRFLITDREVLDASLLGLEIAGALRKLFPGEIDLSTNVKLIGSREVLRRLDSGEDPRLLHHHARESLKSFLDIRRKYQLYPESAASARPPGA